MKKRLFSLIILVVLIFSSICLAEEFLVNEGDSFEFNDATIRVEKIINETIFFKMGETSFNTTNGTTQKMLGNDFYTEINHTQLQLKKQMILLYAKFPDNSTRNELLKKGESLKFIGFDVKFTNIGGPMGDNVTMYVNKDHEIIKLLNSDTINGVYLEIKKIIPAVYRNETKVYLKSIEEEIIPEKTPEQKCFGCWTGQACLKFQTRVIKNNQASYCNIDNTLKTQKKVKENCLNNYECESNKCIEGKCFQEFTLWERMKNWVNDVLL